MKMKAIVPLAILGVLVATTSAQAHSHKKDKAPVITGPTYVNYDTTDSVELNPDNSLLGTACNGSDVNHSIRLLGDTFMNVKFTISRIQDYGESKGVTYMAPASYGVQTLTPVMFTGSKCAGHSIKTIVRNENGKTYLDWWLEISPPHEPSNGKMSDPWMVSGRELIDTRKGIASGKTSFVAFGENMVVHVNATPGSLYLTQWRHQRVLEFEYEHQTSLTKGHLLPDEKADRTLSDDMVGQD